MFFSTIEFDELKEYKDKVMYVSGFSVVVVLAVFFCLCISFPRKCELGLGKRFVCIPCSARNS